MTHEGASRTVASDGEAQHSYHHDQARIGLGDEARDTKTFELAGLLPRPREGKARA